ncbi:MAG: TetR family transcriptional regulator [Labilithrix sp.]|nr:TetR family transcriptional regulator [Labilithrix sp.]MBX3224701.1 TetR family transcriptional regulator [Labilithrix sp.]
MTPGGEDTPPSRPPALRKRKKLRKEEIVAEATRLFAERGYEGTSMGDLAERVGLRKASLFHHFESKDALYATVLTQLIASVQEAIAGAATAEGSFVDRLDGLTDAITATLGAQPHAARLFIREAMDWGPVMREQLADTVQVVLAASVAFARAGQGAGVFRPELDPEHIIITLIGVYFIPFVIDRTIEGFTGQSPFEAPFIDERRRTVREQIRNLVLVPSLR